MGGLCRGCHSRARIFDDADDLEAVVVCRVIAEVLANRILAFQELADKSLVYDRNGGSFFIVSRRETLPSTSGFNRIEEMLMTRRSWASFRRCMWIPGR